MTATESMTERLRHVQAEPDRDAEIVISQAADLIEAQAREIERLRNPRQSIETALGAVLVYEDQGGSGVYGQIVGADGSGQFSVLFFGSPNTAHAAARDYLRRLEASGRRITSAYVVTNEDGYSGPHVRTVVVAELPGHPND